ncbi:MULTISPECIES: hypothetical protein [Halorussus]|uniref:hypothetical protein n=1 Tax=Halorussus TaxID=1070314 RepID=UPI00209D6BE7|nr:hypothetical protein [Halorussus vallis]USZ76781.1 hypothetical protein NGM07_05500 [Halorussus vallis]
MKRRPLIAVGLVFAVVLAGCAGFGPSGSDTTTESTTMEPADTTTATTTAATTTTATADTTTDTQATSTTTAETSAGEQTSTTERTGTTATTATTTTASWSKPKSPNKPLQDKRNESSVGDRIRGVTVVQKTQASGSGYSDFDLRIGANTSMSRVDPADHGTVRGEPYFVVYAHASFEDGGRFTYLSGDLLARSSVEQNANGTYTVEIQPEALERAGVEKGNVELTVILLDEDSEWDDIYGVQKVTVEYSPEQ